MRERKVRTAAGPLGRIAIGLAVAGLALPLAARGAEVYFSPNGGCTTAVVREIGAARQSIEVQAYSFTSAPIARALAEAKERGVHIQVILDKSNRTARYSGADYLIHHGIPTRIDAAHAIAHNKVMIIDDAVVLTGSFNSRPLPRSTTPRIFWCCATRSWPGNTCEIGRLTRSTRRSIERMA